MLRNKMQTQEDNHMIPLLHEAPKYQHTEGERSTVPEAGKDSREEKPGHMEHWSMDSKLQLDGKDKF